MFRPSFTALIALSLSAAAVLPGCKTIYSDMYSPRRNHFKPEKETAKPSDVLPEPMPMDTTTPLIPAAPAPAPAPGEPGAPAAPAPAPAPGAAPAIPGL